MKYISILLYSFLLFFFNCKVNTPSTELSITEKSSIQKAIRKNLDDGLNATINKDIEGYASRFPPDLIIYDESGEIISKEKQKEYALRDWAIIDTTLNIKMDIDSIQFLKRDSVIVFTSQKWERIMFQRDGITKDTVVTTQKHRETWKTYNSEWFGYEIEELGGKIFINGEPYSEK